MYITDWNQVPYSAEVIEDTYPEVYVVIEKNGEKWLRELTTGEERPCDFEPNCIYDQPWIRIN